MTVKRPARCLVSAEDYARHFSSPRTIVTGLRGLVIGQITPSVARCIYCSDRSVDPKHDPYCSSRCAINAQQE